MFGTELIQPIIKEVKKLIETRPNWEYKIVKNADVLNELGDSGWELIMVVNDKFYFKRKKQ